jgi:hypothetical protein
MPVLVGVADAADCAGGVSGAPLFVDVAEAQARHKTPITNIPARILPFTGSSEWGRRMLSE